MKLRKYFLLFSLTAGSILLLPACDTLQQVANEVLTEYPTNTGVVSDSEIASGLRQALEIGIGKGANQLATTNGYFKNPTVKILFPPEARKVENTLRDLGLGSEVDKVVLSLNRAAEDAAKSAKPIFVDAIRKMTINDARDILIGSNKTAATDYLRRTTTNKLEQAFSPVIGRSLNKVDATKYWSDIMNQYNKLPMVQKINPDLQAYVTEMALQGLFKTVEKEEANIRKNPVARTTELLKRVFRLQD